LVVDPSEAVIEVFIKALDYFLFSRKYGHTAEEVVQVHNMAVDLLETCKLKMPERTGTKNPDGTFISWDLKKPHTTLHQVQMMIMIT
jgi:hypothetical protein